jgi:hypothetical protein
MNCLFCLDTGKTPGSEYLDCTKCESASEISVREKAVKQFGSKEIGNAILEAYRLGMEVQRQKDMRWLVPPRPSSPEEFRREYLCDFKRDDQVQDDYSFTYPHPAGFLSKLTPRSGDMQSVTDAGDSPCAK